MKKKKKTKKSFSEKNSPRCENLPQKKATAH
jgi:hypothetical protein